MDQKLVKYLTTLREEAEASRRGGSSDVPDIILDISNLTVDMLLDDHDAAFAVSAVFDEDTGVFAALDSLVSQDKGSQKAREICFSFLSQFISRIGNRVQPYASLIKDKCLNSFRREDSKSVQAAILTPLHAILELSLQEDIELDFSLDWVFVEKMLSEYRKAKTNSTLKSNILVLIGYTVENFPRSFDEESMGSIMKLCLDTLEEQLKSGKDPIYVLVSGAVRCLDSLLTWYDKDAPAGGSIENSRRIYSYMEQVIHFREELKRYETVKAGLRFLSRHSRFFCLRLVENSTTILKWLQLYCTHTNAQIREVAYPAVNQFISEVVNCIVSNDHRLKSPQNVFKKIFTESLAVLDSTNSDWRLKSLAILIMGKLSPLIVKYSGKESLPQVFYRLVAFGNFNRRESAREDSLKFSVTLVAAFAEMVVYFDSIENYMVSLIVEAVGNIFHGYPYLFPKQRYGAYDSLEKIFKALFVQETIFIVFLNNIVWSCLERAMEPMEDQDAGAPLWKHYVGLWHKLLMLLKKDDKMKTDQEEENIEDLEDITTENSGAELQEQVYDCLLRFILKAMKELNVKYTVKSMPTQQSSLLSGNNEDIEGIADLIEPSDPIQMKKFLNLVLFVQEFLSSDFTELFLKWVYPFGRCLIELSSDLPLVSGFYKLLAICMKKADEKGYFIELESDAAMEMKNIAAEGIVPPQDRELCTELFKKYLQEVLITSRRYKLELLVSCLHLCLSAPTSIMKIESLVGPIISALKIGLRHSPLAMVAMDCLEGWHQFQPKRLEPLFHQILPYFNNYLVNHEHKEGDGASHSALKHTYGSNNSSVNDRYRKSIHENKVQLDSTEQVQLRIQKFLGKIGGQNHLLVPDKDLLQMIGVGGLSWDTTNQVKFTLPFKDIKPDIWLDTLLLRIVEISTSSSDRSVKVAASELLHAVAIVMVGSAAKGPMRRRGEERGVHYEKIYKHLFPAILQLATDVELVTRQLFSDFVKQLIHWFTSNTQKENPDSMALLDSILEGITDPENGSLREFCAECFAEYLRWSVRHASSEGDNVVNAGSVFRRLYARLDHPNPYHRLGAAMAAHLIYPVLRENGTMIDMHILELLFFCIKSIRIASTDDMETGSDKILNKVITGLQRLVERNMNLLLKTKKDRKLFSSIHDFLDWLFNQTCRPEENCRKICMGLFSSICKLSPVGSPANWFKNKFSSPKQITSAMKVFDIELQYPEDPIEKNYVHLLNLWMAKFVCSIHWYGWALNEGLVTADDMLIKNDRESLKVSLAVETFLRNTSCQSMHIEISPSLTPAEKETFASLRITAISTVLCFLKDLIYVELRIRETDIKLDHLLKNCKKDLLNLLERLVPFSATYFLDLLCEVFFCPRKIALNGQESERVEELLNLSVKITSMLCAISSVFKDSCIQSFRHVLTKKLKLIDLPLKEGSEGKDLLETEHILKSCQKLHLAGMLLPALEKEDANSIADNLLSGIFSIGKTISPALQAIATDILVLAINMGIKASHLLELVLGTKPGKQVGKSTSSETTPGTQFYFNFRGVVVQQMKFSYKVCLPVLTKEALHNHTARLLLNAIVDDYLKNQSITKSSFLTEFVKHIQVFQSSCNADASLSEKLFFLEILQKLFLLDSDCSTVLAPDEPTSSFIIEIFCSLLESKHQALIKGASRLLETSALMTLKSHALVLVPYFLKSSIGGNVRHRLLKSIENMVSHHLLVREEDIPTGSNERFAYMQMLDRLQDAVLVGGQLELLEVIFPLLNSHVKVTSNKVLEIFEAYADIVGDNRDNTCSFCLRILNDCDKGASLKHAVLDHLFVPCILKAPVDFLICWYEKRIVDLKEALGKPSQNIHSSSETEQDFLIVKIAHYKLVEMLFILLDAESIREKITPLAPNQQLIQNAMNDSRGKNDPTVLPFRENLSLWRELHIAAYNCLSWIVMRTQDQEKVYVFLFKDYPGKLLWQNIIDCNKVYSNFPVETSMLKTSYDTIKSIQRSRARTKGNMGITQSLSSQYIFGSTISEEPTLVNTFVPNQTAEEAPDDNSRIETLSEISDTVTDKGVVEKYSVDFDDFDLHPSMKVILQLIEHCQEKFVSKSSREEMPDWMKALHSVLDNSSTPINVCLFIAKVVTKARRVFAPFSSSWFRPYIQAVLRDPENSGGKSFHYMLRDICITLIEWNLTEPSDVFVASSLVNHLISVMPHSSKLVLQANLEIINIFLKTWKNFIHPDYQAILSYLTVGGKNLDGSEKSMATKRSAGLQLLGGMLTSNMLICGSSEDFSISEEDICKAILLNLGCKVKNVYEAASEVLGIILKHINEGNIKMNEKMFQQSTKQTLLSIFKEGDVAKFLSIIDKITLRFAVFLEGYVSMVLDVLPRIHGSFRVTALNILLRRPSLACSLFSMISPFLSRLLSHRDEDAQSRSLQLVAELVKELPESVIKDKIVPILCDTFSSHETAKCRELYYNILVFLYKERNLTELEVLRRHLLLGLNDDSDIVRKNLQFFWHSQLSENVMQRFLEIIHYVYDPEIEGCWPQITNVLLLKLCEDSVDFERPIFDAPLSECEFHEYTINTSWLGGTLPMTPLFSETQGSNLEFQGTLDNQKSSDNKGSMNSRHMIRATVAPSPSPSMIDYQSSSLQDIESVNLPLSLSQTEASSSQNFVEYKGALVDPNTKLKRRIFHSSTSRTHTKTRVLDALRRRQSRLLQQNLERANKVQMMRQYRIGELPDIEIAHKDVIVPLSSLAEKDAMFGRLLLSALFQAVLSLPTNELKKAQSVSNLLFKSGIESALQRTRYEPAFVGCTMDLCLEFQETSIDSKLVGTSAKKSHNFPVGVLFLENTLLHENLLDQVHERNKKRHCGSNRRPSLQNTCDEAWLELVNLYKSLGESDIVLSIYKTNLAKVPITRHALEAQLQGEFSKALQLYDKATNELDKLQNKEGVQISQIEQDIWYNQRLQCLVELNRWQDIMEDTLYEIKSDATEEPDLRKLWLPSIQDPYLDLFMKGSVKLRTYSSLLSRFVQETSDDPIKRELLLSNFSAELASLAVVTDQFDLAVFYLMKFYESFRMKWSSVHPLATASKHILLKKLQQVVELDEYVEHITKERNEASLTRLFNVWHKRWPSPQFDDVEAWDDVLQNRLLYFEKTQQLVGRQLLKEDGDFDKQRVVDLDFEKANIFYEAARGLILQGSYDASQGYMNQYMAAIEGSNKKEKLNFDFFNTLVKLRCLQADRESTIDAFEAVTMLQQVRDYVTSTARKALYQNQPKWRAGLKMLEGDVTSKLATFSLKSLSENSVSPKEIENCVSLFGSAYAAYSKLFSEVSSADPFVHDEFFTSRKIAKAYIKFAFFCDELLNCTKQTHWNQDLLLKLKKGDISASLPPSSEYPVLVVRYIMKAIQMDNNLQIQHGIARVLTLLGHYSNTHSEFVHQQNGIPCWLFIAWIPQILAVLEKEEGAVLVSVLEDIAHLYPQALYFPYNASKSDFGPIGQERTNKISALLNNPLLNGLVHALEDLTYPEQRLQYWLSHIRNCISVGNTKDAEATFHQMFEDCLDSEAMSSRKSGTYNEKFAKDYSKKVLKALGMNGSKLQSMDEKKYAESIKDVAENLAKSQRSLQTGKISLGSLSKWMAEYDESGVFVRQVASNSIKSSSNDEEFNKSFIEIPGHYTGFKKPDPSSHVKLISFDQTLTCLSSKQRPKILKMRGSDEKDYKFLVKGGEDLRLDQRIEQLFGVMNEILSRDVVCSRKKLSLRTYAVVPISKQCGVIEFMEDTSVIDDVIRDGLMHKMPSVGHATSKQEKNTPAGLLSSLRTQYQDWILKKGGSSAKLSESYTNMYKKASAEDIKKEMEILTSQVPWDALKTGISKLATSAESFLALRSQFTRSLSASSICCYVAGVGDRHLSNFLLDTKRGTLIPIDFGYSFGTGVILLPVPELIPFRLTPQFTNVLLPLDAVGLLRNDMISTLSALHSSRDVLSAVLDVFTNEPLMDWKNEAMRTSSMRKTDNKNVDLESQDFEINTHEEQHVALKVENAHRKLNLWNPAEIVVSELHSSVHSGKTYLNNLERIVRGNPETNIRAKTGRKICKSVQEQVDCLIDQATDPNLLGRIWVGWQPWL